MFDDEDEELLELFTLVPFKRKSTHEMFSNREAEGAYSLLIKKYLMSDEDKFVGYFRITPLMFHAILEKISDDISTEPTNRNPKPISAKQKLCLTLR